jgi:large subunit ribosomal protein L21
MFAFIKHSGKQFKVSEGSVITVDKMEAQKGTQITVQEVPLLVADDNSVTVNPKASVVLEVLAEFRTKKVLVLKQRPKKGYRRKKGHRQTMTRLIVKSISV